MQRPSLTSKISPLDFKSYYWLKEELVAFCRQEGLSTAGGKQAISERIIAYLTTGSTAAHAPVKQTSRTAARLPKILTPDTVIGANWRCSEPLRAFFEDLIGPRFHFNAAMRSFIQHGEGKTLRDAAAAWYTSQAKDQPETEIAAQFEYNRHMREFFKANPGQSRAAALAAWNAKKAQRKELDDDDQ